MLIRHTLRLKYGLTSDYQNIKYRCTMKRILLFSFVFVFLYSCTEEVSESPSINVSALIDNKIELNLSDIWSRIEYIPLESNSECFIKAVKKIVFDDNHILLYDRDSRKLMLFDGLGNYLKDFMNYGRGPNEFFEITSIDCNSNHELLILRNGQFIDIVKFDQTMINTIKLSEATPKLAKWLTNDIMVLFYPYPSYLLTKGYEICFIDRNGKIIKRSLKRETKGVEYGTGSGIIRVGINNNEMYYWYRYSDTVYTIKPSMEVIPRYAFLHDDRNIPYQEIIKDIDAGYTDNKKYIVESYDEWQDYIFITMSYDRHYIRGVINQKLGVFGNTIYTYDHRIYKYIYSGLVNDIDGGFPFWPNVMPNDGSAINVIDPLRIKETTEFNLKQQFDMDARFNEKLRTEIISKINVYSNPIIMRVSK